jgi:hypothetical protein
MAALASEVILRLNIRRANLTVLLYHAPLTTRRLGESIAPDIQSFGDLGFDDFELSVFDLALADESELESSEAFEPSEGFEESEAGGRPRHSSEARDLSAARVLF